MSLNQEFHEHLQAGRLTEAISLVVGQLVELKITTKANSGRLHTTVDLLNGQITNTVDPAFFSDKSSQKLLEFHTNQIAVTAQVVREQLRSLQDLLRALTPAAAPENIANESDLLPGSTKQSIEPVNSLGAAAPEIVSPQASETLPVTLTEAALPPSITEKPEKASEPLLSPAEPEANLEITAAGLEPSGEIVSDETALVNTPEVSRYENRSERVNLPEILLAKPESRAGIASGLAAALAQTSALDPSEAAAIPNKFDQALRSAGVRSTTEKDPHPFMAQSTAEPIVVNLSPVEEPIEQEQQTELIPKQELIDLLQESEDDWDEWLLEEDNILSELSSVTKDKLPDLESHWLSAAGGSAKPLPTDWEEFMPEYPEVSSVASKNQANVERFRQNLVNDPQLMSELLAELDDLEEMQESSPKP